MLLKYSCPHLVPQNAQKSLALSEIALSEFLCNLLKICTEIRKLHRLNESKKSTPPGIHIDFLEYF